MVFQPAKASSDRSECVRVAPDDAFYCNPCLSKSSYNWKLFLRKCWLLQPLAVLNIDFVFNVQVPWPQIYIFFVFEKPHQECFDACNFMLPSFSCDDFKLLPVLTTSH